MLEGGFTFRKSKKQRPGISSSASADIAFLLLVFFLITSSLESQTGIYRRMDAPAAEKALKKRAPVLDRNLLELALNEHSQLIYNDSVFALENLRELSQTFITNPNHVDFLPETPDKHVIRLQISRDADYQSYLSVLSELHASYSPIHIYETEAAKGDNP
ncbi:MAG: biopolymer transporter ExbD [Candidatus Symbiothrix sp.]|jgi:biopolymer transport protein ExbD|nr:biopolymer transporter ExbD [Candidatus Symbiothrix sp.]